MKSLDHLIDPSATEVGFRFLILLGTSSDVIQEFGGTAVQRLGDFHDIFETDVSLATLHIPHESSMNACLVRKCPLFVFDAAHHRSKT